jgi:ketosteroid isomerase-like protein
VTSGNEHPDVALVLQAFQAFEVREGSLDEYFTRFWAHDGVIEFIDGFPISGRYQGMEGYKRWFADSYAPYDDVRRRLDSIRVEGERVVALLTVTGRPKDDDTELEVQLGNTYELEDGRIKYLRIYVGHERALEAARNGG